jgi:hypothetical protein
MNENPNLRALFCGALEQPTPAERSRYLDEHCGGDGELRARVEALLAAHDAAGQFLGGLPPTSEPSPTTDPCNNIDPGARLGP